MRPKLGFMPTTPQKLAGLRQEPPPSVPMASGPARIGDDTARFGRHFRSQSTRPVAGSIPVMPWALLVTTTCGPAGLAITSGVA